MSHAVVLVVGEDVDGQLAAYDEGREVEPYRDYESDPWFSRLAKEEGGADPTDLVAMAKFANERWPDEEQYAVDENGLYRMSTYNPESKWDWYTVGGRWAGSLTVKPLAAVDAPNVHVNQFSEEMAAQERAHFAPVMDGRHTDSALNGEIDWEAMRLERLAKIDQRWDGYLKVLAEKGAEEAQQEALWTYGLDAEELALGREAHLAKVATQHPLSWVQAVVAEGVWREKGRLGWFGASSDGPEERQQWDEWFAGFMAKMPESVRLTMVDYHI